MSTNRCRLSFVRVVVLLVICTFLSGSLYGAQAVKKKKASAKNSKSRVAAVRRASPVKRSFAARTFRKASFHRPRRAVYYNPWTEPSYADSTVGDNVDGEDLEVRRAAVEALGPFNGTVVVVDPNTGRILTIVNQKLALGNGFTPCSTIKVSVALAALNEKLIERTTPVRLYGRTSMALTEALARSNNPYFANLGIKLGYERVNSYARQFGYGEKAGLDIPGEHPGYFPPAPPRSGGVGMMTSFGQEISQTPLQLAALMSAISNGGTLYYLQYPKTHEELNNFEPKVKRHLDIEGLIPEVKPGMLGAVEFGTARRAHQDDPILGKTGTCSQDRTHLGWFGSFNDVGKNRLVVVVLLTGGRPVMGPVAAGVAGEVYKRLSQKNYFATNRPSTTESLVGY